MVISDSVYNQFMEIMRYSEGRKIAVWGCGWDGKILAKVFFMFDKQPDAYCDSDIKKHGKNFLNSFVILDPKEVMQNKDYYIVVATEEYDTEIAKIIENSSERTAPYGFYIFKKYDRELKDTSLDEYPIDAMLDYVSYYKEKHNVKVHFFFAPEIKRILNPSKLESALSYSGTFIRGEEGGLKWLQSKPPHIAKMYEGFGYTDEFIKGLFTWPRHAIALSGKAVTVGNSEIHNIGGTRLTTDLPSSYEHFVHFFGCSTMSGLGVEDKYTIPSCFQRILNDRHPEKYYSLNHSRLFATGQEILRAVTSIEPRDNDIIIIEPWYSGELVEKCIARNIPYYDLQYMFNRPHSMGEVFFDAQHVNHTANQAIAEKMYDILFSPAVSNAPKFSLERYRNIHSQQVPGIEKYLSGIGKHIKTSANAGAVVVNCNPFTLGHYHLISHAARESDILYVFVVEEDRSVFPFEDRIRLVKEGLSGLDNVVVLPSGKMIISTVTLPEYFDKEVAPEQTVDASLDLELFRDKIAPLFGIKTRFIGQEPIDMVTRQYNEQMKFILPTRGIRVCEIPRIETEDGTSVISASRVRKALEDGDYGSLSKMVPPFVKDYLLNRK